MDIERIKKLSESKVKAGNISKRVRSVLKDYEHTKQEVQEDLSETFKPILEARKETKETINEKQDKMLEELQKNQKAVTPYYYQVQQLELPGPSGEKPPEIVSNMNKGFTDEELRIFQKHKLPLPSDVLIETWKDGGTARRVWEESGEINQNLGRSKAHLSTTEKTQKENKDKIDSYTKEIEAIKNYGKRIGVIEEGEKTLKVGIYTQPKRNAYKIDNAGKYGNLTSDIPKLMGHLRLIAKKNGQTVIEKKVDFDTIDLLTTRFKCNKKYSYLSRMVFDELNRLSEIPIHRTSKKYKKMGSGVLYYNNPEDLLSRLELLGGSFIAGNNGVKEEFSQIVHVLNKLGQIDNEQLVALLKGYVI